jgi:hypothetical protein
MHAGKVAQSSLQYFRATPRVDQEGTQNKPQEVGWCLRAQAECGDDELAAVDSRECFAPGRATAPDVSTHLFLFVCLFLFLVR